MVCWAGPKPLRRLVLLARTEIGCRGTVPGPVTRSRRDSPASCAAGPGPQGTRDSDRTDVRLDSLTQARNLKTLKLQVERRLPGPPLQRHRLRSPCQYTCKLSLQVVLPTVTRQSTTSPCCNLAQGHTTNIRPMRH